MISCWMAGSSAPLMPLQVVQAKATMPKPSCSSSVSSPASFRYSSTALEPGASEVLTQGLRVRPRRLALRASSAAAMTLRGLLDEKELAFEGLSATSAGAMNAAAFAYGLAVDGREGARKALTDYWKRVSEAARLGPLQPSVIDRMLEDHKLSWSP